MRAWQDDTPLDLQDLAMLALPLNANTSRQASDASPSRSDGFHQRRGHQQKGALGRRSQSQLELPNLYPGVGEEAPPAGWCMARNGERHPPRRPPKPQTLVSVLSPALYQKAEVRRLAA